MIIRTVFSLHELTVYEITQSSIMFNGYYWKDSNTPQGCGPFHTLQLCVDHYAQGLPKIEPIEPDKVITVDFKNKRRAILKLV